MPSGRAKPGNGGAKRFLDTQERGFIRVPLSGPEEAFEAIFPVARHEMDVQMRHALTDPIIDCDKRAIRLQALFDRSFDQLHMLKERPGQVRRQIGKGFDMLTRNEQTMPREKWSVIQKRQKDLILKNQSGWNFTAENATECTRRTNTRLAS